MLRLSIDFKTFYRHSTRPSNSIRNKTPTKGDLYQPTPHARYRKISPCEAFARPVALERWAMACPWAPVARSGTSPDR